MDGRHKPSMDGVATDAKVAVRPKKVSCSDFLLRILGMALTLVAAVVVVLGKETKIVNITITDGLPPLPLLVTAKWQYVSAFVYFVVSNAIACSYAAFSLLPSTVPSWREKNGKAIMALIVLDLIIMGLLFSANGAAAAVGIIGRNGNSHLNWNKVCNVFDGFCNHLMASIALSLLGSLVFFWLVVLAALNLQKKSR